MSKYATKAALNWAFVSETPAKLSHTVKNFLEEGFPVRGTVRSKEKGEYLVNLFKDSKTPFEYVVVEDIAQVYRSSEPR